MSRNVVLAAGKRTPFGDFGGSLKDTPLSAPGAHTVRATLATAGLDAARIDHLTFGNVMSVDYEGNFISRKVALDAGLPIESGALAVNRPAARAPRRSPARHDTTCAVQAV